MPSTVPEVENTPEAERDFIGRALFEKLDYLDGLSKGAGATPLSEFVYVDPEELAGILDDSELEIPDMPEWFSAQEGLNAIAALLGGVKDQEENAELLEDLRLLQKILAAAHEAGNRWRLVHDI